MSKSAPSSTKADTGDQAVPKKGSENKSNDKKEAQKSEPAKKAPARKPSR